MEFITLERPLSWILRYDYQEKRARFQEEIMNEFLLVQESLQHKSLQAQMLVEKL